MTAYYNENDPKAAAWLRELIKRGLIAQGEVDERSIVDVAADDLAGFGQCHFFAGIGGWSYALRLANWPDDRPVWTGSCPCQPFSVAGKGLGTADARHLWPEFQRLIAECRPASVFGEQVASKPGREWLAGVRADLEALGYAVGAADLCAAGVGAPHIRQRLYWMAESERRSTERHGHEVAGEARGMQGEAREQRLRPDVGNGGATGGMALSDGGQSGDGGIQRSGQHRQQPQDGGVGGMGDAEQQGPQGRNGPGDVEVHGGSSADGSAWTPSAWSGFAILPCTDGKSRRVESGTFPLAHGIPARMGRLRGYGNAIVPQVAAEFVRAAA